MKDVRHQQNVHWKLYIEQKISLTGKIEDLSIEELESKMKKIYEDNKVLIEGEYTVGKEE